MRNVWPHCMPAFLRSLSYPEADSLAILVYYVFFSRFPFPLKLLLDFIDTLCKTGVQKTIDDIFTFSIICGRNV